MPRPRLHLWILPYSSRKRLLSCIIRNLSRRPDITRSKMEDMDFHGSIDMRLLHRNARYAILKLSARDAKSNRT